MPHHNRDRHNHNHEKDEFQPIEQAEDTRITSDMSHSEIEQRVRRRIEVRRKQVNAFVANLISYIGVNVGLWIVWGFTAIHGRWLDMPWPLFVMFFWGIGVAIQGYHLYQNAPSVVARRERTIQDEVARVKARMGLPVDYQPDSFYDDKPKNLEKPKNNVPTRLSADGEIVPLEDLLADEPESVESVRYMNSGRG